MEVTVLSTATLLFFVLDPFGNIPIMLSLLKNVETSRVKRVIAREMGYGLLILLAFLFLGSKFMSIFHIETNSVRIAGAVIFFIIGIKLIFPQDKEGASNVYGYNGEPFIVPIAVPMIAGPSALATLLVLERTGDLSTLLIFVSLTLAWAASAIILLFSPILYKLMREKGLQAMEKLMGMILLILSVQMFVDGIRGLNM